MNVENDTAAIQGVPAYCYHYLDRPHLQSTTMYAVHVANVVFNAVLSITAILGNGLVMFALRKVTHMGLPSKALLFSLALSDFGVGLVVQPIYIAHMTGTSATVRCTAGIVFDLLSGHFSIVTLFTMTAISIDKFLAIKLRMRYRSVVTFKRVLIVLALIWLVAVPWAMTWLWKRHVYLFFVTATIPFCIIVSTLAFVKIRIILFNQQCQLRASSARLDGSGRKSKSITVVSYRRSVVTLFLIYCALLLCYFPTWVVTAMSTFGSIQSPVATHLTLTLVFMNSSVNPLLYLWRMSEVRDAAREFLAAAKCCKKFTVIQQTNEEGDPVRA